MVKINGQRVNLGEIEGAIRSMPGVEGAAVRDFTYPSGQLYLCGYYVAEEGAVDEAKLREHLGNRLAHYMIPTFLMRIDSIPTNVNGKLDRAQLLAPDLSSLKSDYAAPANELEARICGAFEDVLRCGCVGVNDNFFLLGGDSVKAMQLQNALDDPALSSEVIFKAKTPRAIAKEMADQGPDLLGKAMRESRQFWPLTPSQMGVYLACVQNPQGLMYNNPIAMRFAKERFDADRIIRTVSEALSNHGALAMRVVDVMGAPMMTSTDGLDLQIPVKCISEDMLDSELAAFVRPFSLAEEAPCRAQILEMTDELVLEMDFHHVAFDGTSLGVILKEVADAFEGRSLAPERVSQLALGAYEEELVESERAEASRAFFEEMLGALDEPAMLVEDYPEDPRVENKPSSMLSVLLDGDLSRERVERFCTSVGITPNVLFLGAFQYAIAKFSGQDQVLVCTATHGRHDARLANTVGMLVRTVPLFAQFGRDSESRRIAEFLGAVRDRQRDAIENDAYPFVKLAGDLGISADILFAYQSDGFNTLELDGCEIPLGRVPVDSAVSKLDMQVFKRGDTFDVQLGYRSDVFSEETIRSFLDMYETIIGEFLERDTLAEIALCSEKRQAEIDGFNETDSAYDASKTVVDWFRARASESPDAVAVSAEDRALTYAELDDATDRLASYISSLGIGRDGVVSVLISRSSNMAVCSLGVSKSGAAYQPLDPSYPTERLEFMISDAGAKLLIADEELLGKVAGYDGAVLLTKDIPGLAEGAVPDGPSPDDLFIMLYTSGTTGTPKGVMLEYANIACFCAWYEDYVGLDPSSRVAAYASFGFDACMMDTWPTLSVGACLYIVPEQIRLNLALMEKWFSEHRITHSFLTTQVGRIFATTAECSTLKFLGVGGETLAPLEISDGFADDFEMHNFYGPTEATILITAHRVEDECGRIPIGGALDNVKLYVVDPLGRRLPQGAVGELLVSGPHVGRGYLNRPERKDFCRNPYSTDPKYERMYCTGDLARFLPNGEIDFIGRRDGQVKVRGFRIELTEVESVIRDCPGIEDVCVVAFDAPGGEKALAAYVVCEGEPDVEGIAEFISQRKPSYMVPEAIVRIDSIPLNVNSKVDKRKLPKPVVAADDLDAGAPGVSPSTRLGFEIHAMAAKIVGRDDFGMGTDLTRLGLTSLSVIRLAMDLKNAYGFEADTKKLMGGCTVIDLEDMVGQYLLDTLSNRRPESKPRVRKASYPLTSSQFGVYADCMRSPNSTCYNIPFSLAFPGGVGAEDVAAAVRDVLLAHPYVFTHLVMDGDDVAQAFVAEPEIEVPVVQVSLDELETLESNFVQPFNLFRGPLFRTIVADAPDGVHLLADFHHIVFDGASTDIFLRELKGALEGTPAHGEDFSYFDYAQGDAEARDGSEYLAAERFFDGMFESFEMPSEIPPDVKGRSADAEDGLDGAAREVAYIDMGASEHFCRERGLTPAALYLAATLYVVSRFTGERGAYISTISSGREDLAASGCFGMFVRTLAVGTEIGDVTSAEFAHAAKDLMSAAIEHEIYPYAELCRRFEYAPEVMYEYQLGVTEGIEIDGRPVTAKSLAPASAKFKVAIHVEMHDGRPAIVVYYDSTLYTPELMQTLAASVEVVAQSIVAHPEGSIRKTSMLAPDGLSRVLGFETTCEKEPVFGLMHEAFMQMAKAVPDRAAVIATDRTLTYAELDEESNRVANALIARGYSHGDRAVVVMSRTSLALSVMLGVLKAGGAYIPTSFEYPQERINTIIEDSAAAVVIDDALAGELAAHADNSVPGVEVAPDDLCYMIYTSGSTGRPKGVMVRHRGVANYLTNDSTNPQVALPVELGSVYGSVTTLAFDLAVKEIWMSLANGLTLAFAGDEHVNDPDRLGRFFLDSGVDVFNATPSRILAYMESASFARAMAACKVILSGGEPYPPALLDLLRAKTDARLLNTYGPTETTVSSNVADLTCADRVVVGRPLLNYRETIIDMDGNRVPVGVMGELVISGLGVAAGYHNLPEQTMKAFVEFEGRESFRSGDWAKWTEDGNVIVCGRKDSQVKLRGLRIELGEVERALASVEGISRAVAAIRQVGSADALCAWYVAKTPINEDEIRDQIGRMLADYMVPSHIIHLEEMPLTPNGKVNMRGLPAPVQKERAGVEASSEMASLFCEIYAKILGLEKVYADDSFFELGGSSLTVTRVVIAAGKEGVNITYGDVFAHPTPEGLADFLGGEAPKSEFADLSDYDYSAIDELLGHNTLDAFRDGQQRPLGRVLLTGATGFLGVHILAELLRETDSDVVCLLRGKRSMSPEARLNGIFHYYFEEVLRERYAGRVHIVEGDVTDPTRLDYLLGLEIDTVLNCAAIVKHFSEGTEIEDVNLGGARNMIELCTRANARLVQISTMSVGGVYVGRPGQVERLAENQLYIGQRQNSKYTQSKFLAERAVLEAAVAGLDVKIMRVGTLSPRETDGEYQINFSTNNFMRRLKGTWLVGSYPYDAIEAPFELSPIDMAAKAIVLLSQTPQSNVVFHPYNDHTLMMGDLYSKMNEVGFAVRAAEAQDYRDAVAVAEEDPRKVPVLSGMVAYQNMGHGERLYSVGKSNKLTMQVLFRLGFRWPATSPAYMKRFLVALNGLGFFD